MLLKGGGFEMTAMKAFWSLHFSRKWVIWWLLHTHGAGTFWFVYLNDSFHFYSTQQLN